MQDRLSPAAVQAMIDEAAAAIEEETVRKIVEMEATAGAARTPAPSPMGQSDFALICLPSSSCQALAQRTASPGVGDDLPPN